VKWVAIAALITAFLAVGAVVLAHFIRSADASPKLLLVEERRQRDRDYRFNKPANPAYLCMMKRLRLRRHRRHHGAPTVRVRVSSHRS